MRGLAVLLTFLALAVPVAGETGEVDLNLAEEFRLANTTLALGHLDPGEDDLTDLHAVGADTLDLPDGTLFVCRFEGGRSDEVPPIPTLQERCRNEDAYENPQVVLGDRTWLVFDGNLTLTDPPDASMAALIARNDSLHVAGPTAGTMGASVDEVMAFRPQLPASQVRVETPGETRSYNGTDWIFYLEASGSARLGADGLHFVLPTPRNVTLAPAGVAAMREALEPRTLLDLQAAAVDPDAREPVENATRLLGQGSRLPPLVDGALLGYLNGTVGGRTLDPNQTSMVSLSKFDGRIEGGNLTGTGEVRFVETAGGIAPGLDDPAGVPWILVALVWVAAGVSIALGPAAPTRDLRQRSLAAAGFAIALVVWDGIFTSTLGASALTTSVGQAGLGSVMALAAFEAIALGLAWILLALPIRLAVERWLVDRLAGFVSPAATVALLVFALVSPGSVIAIGRLVAQI